jgi:hypothetical protein
MRLAVRVCSGLVAVVAFAMTSAPVALHAAEPAPAAEKAAPAKKKPAAKKAAAKKAAPATGTAALKEILEGEDVRDFRTFCDGWMQKLRERDRHNIAQIKWDTRDGQVVGEYVGYGTERTCVAREEPGKDPIGKITYRETRYRREGRDPAAAMAGTGTILEQTDVTEIFRYGKGRWQY